MTSEKEQRFSLAHDDDGHWYMIPEDKQEECNKYFSAVYTYWSPDSEPVGDEPKAPDWLERIDNPFCVTFSDPHDECS